MSVRKKGNRLWGCVWDGEINENEFEGRTPEKVWQSISRYLPTTMSKPVANRCSSMLKAQETSRKRERDDEEKDNGDESVKVPTPTTSIQLTRDSDI